VAGTAHGLALDTRTVPSTTRLVSL